MAGLDENGFTPKTLEQIQEELQNELAENLSNIGEVVNTSPSSRFGQLIDIFSSQMSETWDALQDIYNSYYPLTATGSSLDEANSLVDVPRLQAKSSQAQVYLIGDLGTLIPQGNRITVTNTTNDFLLSSKTSVGEFDLTDYEIIDDASAVQVASIANAGTITLSYDSNPAVINYDDTPTEIQSAIEALDPSLEVEVVGGFDGVALGVTEGPGFCYIKLLQTSIDKELNVDASTLSFQETLAVNIDYQSPFVNNLTFSTPAVAGSIDLGWDNNYVTINYNDSAATIEASLETIANVSDVTVTGTFQFNTAVVVTIVSATLSSNQMQQQNNLLTFGDALSFQFGYSLDTPANTLSEVADDIACDIGQLVTIKDPVSGWIAAYNASPTIVGRPTETDAQYRFRRYQELSRTGTATANGIKEAVVEAINSDTYNVSLVENDTDFPISGVIDDMPPHSFEVFVNALDNDSTNNAIAQAIYNSKAVGIKPVSTDQNGRHGDATDVNGSLIEVPFTSTVSVTIYIDVQRTTNPANYPSDGDDQIKANLVDFFNNFQVGEDVYNHRLYSPVNLVPGITDLIINISKTPNPTTDNNIVIEPFETATVELANIVVEDI